MIDRDLIQALDPATRAIVKQALAELSVSTVIMQQLKRGNDRLLSGNEDQPVESLAADIRKWRQASHALTELHQLGLEYIKELNR